MHLRLSRISNPLARRALMVAVAPLMMAYALVAGGVLGALSMAGLLVQSWGPAWRGDKPEPVVCEVGVLGDSLRIHMPLALLAWAAEHGPFAHSLDPRNQKPGDEFRVTDRVAFGRSVAAALRAETSDDDLGGIIHQAFDDAIEQVVDNGDPGFVWPGAGIINYMDKCKRLRTDGPTPCYCCPGECVGEPLVTDGEAGGPLNGGTS